MHNLRLTRASARAATRRAATAGGGATAAPPLTPPQPLRLNSSHVNPFGIRLLNNELSKALFEEGEDRDISKKCDPEKVKQGLSHLAAHKIKPNPCPNSLALDTFPMPELHGNIETHFFKIGQDYAQPYLSLLEQIVTGPSDYAHPPKWVLDRTGWTRYDHLNGQVTHVPAPLENVLTFDVEVCVKEGNAPVIAAALSPQAWYTWVSPGLYDNGARNDPLTPEDLIPIDGGREGSDSPPRVVIGHNVAYDRARIKEQYFLRQSKTRFLDTMSLHIVVSGMTSGQRTLVAKAASDSKAAAAVTATDGDGGGGGGGGGGGHDSLPSWLKNTSMNNLQDVYKLYCGPDVRPLKKAKRDVFVHGSLADIRQDLAELMTYCANDVLATHRVTQKLFPMFRERCPHPVTFAGMLEMGMAYLPTNSNWRHYLRQADDANDELEAETLRILAQHAKEACQLLPTRGYKKDLWLWDQDWKPKNMRVKKTKDSDLRKVDRNAKTLEEKFKGVMATSKNLFKVQPAKPGYPGWYQALCTKTSSEGGFAEPTELSSSKAVVPKLLRLCWKGCPLHRDENEKWGFISLDKDAANNNSDFFENAFDDEETGFKQFPTQILKKFVQSDGNYVYDELELDNEGEGSAMDEHDIQYELRNEPRDADEMMQLMENGKQKNGGKKGAAKAAAILESNQFRTPEIPGCIFTRLPHKDGKENRVGNPLSKNFLDKVRDGVLAAQWGEGSAEKVLRAGKTLSYWKSNQDRIKSQMVVSVSDDLSVIVPQVVQAGTLTRRAVERTWLTASNAKEDRVGSELKSMVQAPPGYSFVGADVDSQELWIAAVIGDSHFTGLHGSTALGWMTLQGSKAQGTDMHSVVAKSVGVSRDQAKILNYGRIYGAGVPFARQLLMGFNPNLSEDKAASLADKMYSETKGNRTFVLNQLGALCYSFLNIKVGPDTGFSDHGGLAVDRKVMNHVVKVKRKLDIYAVYNPLRPSEFELSEDGQMLAMELGMDLAGQFGTDAPAETRLFALAELLRAVAYGKNVGAAATTINAWQKDIKALTKKTIWQGGTESHTFNRLEEIALAFRAKTPVLGARISRVLESEKVGVDYLPSRINWVVQSSAVDYLHLLLVAVQWQMNEANIRGGRFVISIHDEVRYMVRDEDKYKAALALQTANLMVRAMFCSRLGMKGLPEDVAFFSSVDVDSVVRKEPDMECTTPSNPHGLSHGYGVKQGQSLTIQDALMHLQQQQQQQQELDSATLSYYDEGATA